jgi:hypothetical protein
MNERIVMSEEAQPDIWTGLRHCAAGILAAYVFFACAVYMGIVVASVFATFGVTWFGGDILLDMPTTRVKVFLFAAWGWACFGVVMAGPYLIYMLARRGLRMAAARKQEAQEIERLFTQ